MDDSEKVKVEDLFRIRKSAWTEDTINVQTNEKSLNVEKNGTKHTIRLFTNESSAVPREYHLWRKTLLTLLAPVIVGFLLILIISTFPNSQLKMFMLLLLVTVWPTVQTLSLMSNFTLITDLF